MPLGILNRRKRPWCQLGGTHSSFNSVTRKETRETRPRAFKRIGWTSLVAFARKFGLPWPVGKRDAANPKSGRTQKMVQEMLAMLESGVIAAPDDESLEFLPCLLLGCNGGILRTTLCADDSSALEASTWVQRMGSKGNGVC